MSRDLLPTFEEIQNTILRSQANSTSAGSSRTTTTDPDTRQQALQTELSDLQTLNESMDGILESFEHCSESLLKLKMTSASSINLLDRWIKVLSETSYTKEKLLAVHLMRNSNIPEEEYEANVDRLNRLNETVQAKKEQKLSEQEEIRRKKEEKERSLWERREAMERRLYGRKGGVSSSSNGANGQRTTTNGRVGSSVRNGSGGMSRGKPATGRSAVGSRR